MYDMANVKKLKTLAAGAPAAMDAFTAFDKAAMTEGVVPKKYKELIALAVALTTQKPFLTAGYLSRQCREGGRDAGGDCGDGDGGGCAACGRGGNACDPLVQRGLRLRQADYLAAASCLSLARSWARSCGER